VVDQQKLASLIKRLERMRGKILPDGSKCTYLGDGVNDHVTTPEILEFLRPLQEVTIQDQVDQPTK